MPVWPISTMMSSRPWCGLVGLGKRMGRGLRESPRLPAPAREGTNPTLWWLCLNHAALRIRIRSALVGSGYVFDRVANVRHKRLCPGGGGGLNCGKSAHVSVAYFWQKLLSTIVYFLWMNYFYFFYLLSCFSFFFLIKRSKIRWHNLDRICWKMEQIRSNFLWNWIGNKYFLFLFLLYIVNYLVCFCIMWHLKSVGCLSFSGH